MKLVIFDCDGTLVDSQHVIVESMSRAFRTQGLPPPERAAILSIVGLSLPVAMRRLCPEGDADALVEAYKDCFHAVRAEGVLEPLYPGCLAVLSDLHARGDTQLAIATGKSQRGVRLIMEHHGVLSWFSSIQTADDAPSKPHPAMVLQALAATGVDAAQAVMVGDTTYDVEMALNASVVPIGVTWGYHRPDMLAEAGCKTIIRHFNELLPLLETMWAGR